MNLPAARTAVDDRGAGLAAAAAGGAVLVAPALVTGLNLIFFIVLSQPVPPPPPPPPPPQCGGLGGTVEVLDRGLGARELHRGHRHHRVLAVDRVDVRVSGGVVGGVRRGAGAGAADGLAGLALLARPVDLCWCSRSRCHPRGGRRSSRRRRWMGRPGTRRPRWRRRDGRAVRAGTASAISAQVSQRRCMVSLSRRSDSLRWEHSTGGRLGPAGS